MIEIDSVVKKIRFLEKVPIFSKVKLTDEEQAKRTKPKKYFQLIIDLLNAIEGEIIVEIGSMRTPIDHDPELTFMCCNDGHSTFYWCKSEKEIYSVDINFNTYLCVIRNLSKNRNLQPVNNGGIKFLKKFDKKIDLLFLDAWDVYPHIKYSERHLQAYFAAKDKMSDKCIVAIDDTDIAFGGKGKLVIPELIKDGFDILNEGRVTIALRI